VAELEAFAAETMPRYLRPRHWRLVDELPRTPTNKVEKYRLRESLLRELTGDGAAAPAPDRPPSPGNHS
jgi:crotonobetaine/carnitine-CoA ligase